MTAPELRVADRALLRLTSAERKLAEVTAEREQLKTDLWQMTVARDVIADLHKDLDADRDRLREFLTRIRDYEPWNDAETVTAEQLQALASEALEGER